MLDVSKKNIELAIDSVILSGQRGEIAIRTGKQDQISDVDLFSKKMPYSIYPDCQCTKGRVG